MAKRTIQEIWNLAFDDTNSDLNVSGATTGGAINQGTLHEITETIFDESTNTIKVVTSN
jgi:hypothetical protein